MAFYYYYMNGHGEANVALLSLVPPHDEERVEEQQVKKKMETTITTKDRDQDVKGKNTRHVHGLFWGQHYPSNPRWDGGKSKTKRWVQIHNVLGLLVQEHIGPGRRARRERDYSKVPWV